MALSRIVVSVSTVKPVASVQVQAANTVSTSGAGVGAVITRTVPIAAISWINILLDAQIDFRGLNPVVREIKIVLDTAALHFQKSAFDTEAVTDERTLVLFRKVPVENLQARELKTFDLQRQISDEVDATDDLYGVANADDEQVMFFSKAMQPDSFVVGDNLDEIHFGKRPLDSVSSSDQIDYFDLGKSLEDAPQTSEIRTVSIQKPLADTVDAGDEMNALAVTDDGEVMLFSKDIPTDRSYTSDQIDSIGVGKRALDLAVTSDDKTFFVGKSLSDEPATSEAHLVSLSKSLTDESLTSELAAIETGKVLDTAFSSSDAATVEAGKVAESSATAGDELLPFELGKGIEDIPVTSELYAFDVRRVSEDVAVATEQIANHVSRYLSDRVYYPSDGPNQYDTYALAYFLEDYVREGFPAIDFSKALTENKVTSETRTVVLFKPFEEAFSAIDAPAKGLSKTFVETLFKSDVNDILFDKARTESLATSETRSVFFSKDLTESLDATDDFYGVTNTDDDQIMTYGKRESEFLSTSETNTFAFGKLLTDAALSAELKTFDLGKPLADSFSKSDLTVKLNAKVLGDSFSSSDSSVNLVGKRATDASSTADATTAFVGKSLSETISKSDAAAKLAEKVISDTITKSDSTIKTAGKAVSDTAITGETRSFNFSKTLTDIVDATDDFYGVTNTDDDQNVLYAKVASDIVSKSDSISVTAAKGLTESVNKSDSGSLVWTDYWDIGYTVTSSGVYVGNSQTF